VSRYGEGAETSHGATLVIFIRCGSGRHGRDLVGAAIYPPYNSLARRRLHTDDRSPLV
jgi:hypothetical protein